MVTTKDFKHGKKAYIVTKKRGRIQEQFVSECYVVSVGRKYVRVTEHEYSKYTSDFYNLRGDDDYLSEYNSERKLFPTEKAALEDVEKEKLKKWFLEATEYRKIELYTVEQLRKVKEILEEKDERELDFDR